MRVETQPNTFPQTISAGALKLTFSFYIHKRESDRADKHAEWTTPKHVVLTTFAILTDVGLNSAAVALFFSGNLLGAALVKSGHYVAAQTVPQAVTNLKNRIVNKPS